MINIVLTVCAAFTLSRMDFWPRKFLTIMYIFTMYFGGGMIPYYLQIRDLGLMNSPGHGDPQCDQHFLMC